MAVPALLQDRRDKMDTLPVHRIDLMRAGQDMTQGMIHDQTVEVTNAETLGHPILHVIDPHMVVVRVQDKALVKVILQDKALDTKVLVKDQDMDILQDRVQDTRDQVRDTNSVKVVPVTKVLVKDQDTDILQGKVGLMELIRKAQTMVPIFKVNHRVMEHFIVQL
jgi:hypothetical protein